MSAWTKGELDTIGDAEEVEIEVRRPAGTLRNPVTVWAVMHGDAVYIRSAVRGRSAAWFRGVQATHSGRIRAGSLEKDVTFEDADHSLNDEIDAAFRSKYRRYTGRILNSVLTPEARSTTVKVMPS